MSVTVTRVLVAATIAAAIGCRSPQVPQEAAASPTAGADLLDAGAVQAATERMPWTPLSQPLASQD